MQTRISKTGITQNNPVRVVSIDGDGIDEYVYKDYDYKHAVNTHRNKTISKYKYRGIDEHYGRSIPYRAKIIFKGKRYRSSYFKTVEEAAHAYDELAVKFYGKDAVLNFPRKDVIDE